MTSPVIQHTPGPWTLPHFVQPDANCECSWVLTDHLMGAVASVWVSGTGDDWKAHGDNPRFAEAVANAHLICAAPEMIAALREAKAALDNPAIFSKFPVASARIAIADAVGKAEGRT